MQNLKNKDKDKSHYVKSCLRWDLEGNKTDEEQFLSLRKKWLYNPTS